MIDQQHGLGRHEDMVRCLTAARAAGTAALVRVPDNEHGLIGRVLDAGAQGMVCPLVNSAADAGRHVCAALEYARPLVDAGWLHCSNRVRFAVSSSCLLKADARSFFLSPAMNSTPPDSRAD